MNKTPNLSTIGTPAIASQTVKSDSYLMSAGSAAPPEPTSSCKWQKPNQCVVRSLQFFSSPLRFIFQHFVCGDKYIPRKLRIPERWWTKNQCESVNQWCIERNSWQLCHHKWTVLPKQNGKRIVPMQKRIYGRCPCRRCVCVPYTLCAFFFLLHPSSSSLRYSCVPLQTRTGIICTVRGMQVQSEHGRKKQYMIWNASNGCLLEAIWRKWWKKATTTGISWEYVSMWLLSLPIVWRKKQQCDHWPQKRYCIEPTAVRLVKVAVTWNFMQIPYFLTVSHLLDQRFSVVVCFGLIKLMTSSGVIFFFGFVTSAFRLSISNFAFLHNFFFFCTIWDSWPRKISASRRKLLFLTDRRNMSVRQCSMW